MEAVPPPQVSRPGPWSLDEHDRPSWRPCPLQAKGNADLSPRSDPHGEFQGLNCLIERQPLATSAAAAGIPEAEAGRALADCREALHTIRAGRPRPHLDDKVRCNPGRCFCKSLFHHTHM